MADRPSLGLYAHSRLARRYAAYKRDHPIGQAHSRTLSSYEQALADQEAHWAGIEAHLESKRTD